MLRGPGYVGASGQRKIGLLASSALSALSSFSRSSPATYQDTALLRNAPHNLFTFSSAFDNAIWTVAAATLTPVAAAGPTGNAVYKIAETATNATHGFTGPAMPIVAGQSYTISIHYQAAERGFARISCSNGSGQSDVWFNLATGVVGTIFLGGAVARAAIAAVGDWYRCTLSFVATATTSVAAVFRAQQIDAETGYQGVVGSGIYASAAQWEQNPDASTYTHTTTAPVYGPRFNRNTLIAQNFVANPRGEYTATPAFPTSAPPNGWSNGGASNGVTVQYAGSGTNDPATGLPYTDVQWIGTSSATGFVSVWPMDLAGTPAVDGQAWTASLGVQLIAGGAASGFLSAEARGTGGAGGLQATQQNFTATSAVQRLGIPITLATSGAVKSAATLLRVAVTNGVAINCTLRLTGWQFEPGALVNPVSLPPVGQIGPSVLYAGALAGRNMVSNPRGEGYVSGNPGTPPTYWTLNATTSGISRSIVGGGVDVLTGLSYTDVRFFGTATGTNFPFITFETAGQVPAAQGQVWTQSVYLAIVAGAYAPNLGLKLIEYNAAGGQAAQTGSTTIAGSSIPATLTRYSLTTTTANVACASVGHLLTTTFNSGDVIDFTLRIAAPQLEPNRLTPGQLSLPPVGQPSASYIESGARLQIEESRQNSIRNPRGEGSGTATGIAAGTTTGLVAPTNWNFINRGSGLTLDGSPITAYGMTGYRVRLYGTTSASVGPETLEFEARNAIAAVAGQVWSGQFFYRLSAGTVPAGFTFNHRALTFTSGAAVVDNILTAAANPDATLRRATQTITASATTAFVVSGMHMQSFPFSTACDFTIDVFYPDLELGAFPTSIKLPPPGSPAATTRANDLATASLGSWFKTAGTVTNLSTRSSDIAHIDWSKTFGAVTADSVVAPDGATTADLFVPDTSLNVHHVNPPGITFTAGTAYVDSIFAKASGYRYLHVRYSLTVFPNANRAAVFDLQAGTVVAADPGVTATIRAEPGGFYRCAIGATANGSGASQSLWGVNATLNGGGTSQETYAGDGVSGIAFFGHMTEAGALTPGPYIATTSTAVTKTATGPGTVIFKGVMPPPAPGAATGWSLSDGGTGNSIWIYAPTQSTSINGRSLNGGVADADWNLTLAALPAGSTIKVALAWDPATGILRGCVNGGTVFSTTAPIPPGLTTFAEGSIAASRFWNNDIESADYYPASLSNAQLQALTV